MTFVIGFHGTTYENAQALARREFRPLKERKSKWLGPGLYFFQDNFELASTYADKVCQKEGGSPGIFRAEIDISKCLDVTRLPGQILIRNAYRSLCSEWKRPEDAITQKPFALEDGQVRAGYTGKWIGGGNYLDHAVIDRAIQLGQDQKNLTYDTVRGIFIEEGPLFESSWLFEAAYVSIAVRTPETRLHNPMAIPL